MAVALAYQGIVGLLLFALLRWHRENSSVVSKYPMLATVSLGSICAPWLIKLVDALT
jgi:hypothetical protein